MEVNAARFGTPGIITRIGDFLQAELDDLPAPDAVFIGGHGGRLDAIVQRVSTRLPHRGVIVFNSVTAESCELFANAVTRHGCNVVDSQHVTINGFNPILIMKAQKI